MRPSSQMIETSEVRPPVSRMTTVGTQWETGGKRHAINEPSADCGGGAIERKLLTDDGYEARTAPGPTTYACHLHVIRKTR